MSNEMDLMPDTMVESDALDADVAPEEPATEEPIAEPEPAPEEPEEQPRDYKAIAALARQQKRLREERESYQRRMRDLERMEQLKREDPLRWLQEQGVEYSTLTERLLGQPKVEEDPVKSKLQEHERVLEQLRQERMQLERQRYLGGVASYVTERANEYPHLADIDASTTADIAQACMEYVERHHGQRVAMPQILAMLERTIGGVVGKRTKPAAPEEDAPAAPVARTITARAASQRSATRTYTSADLDALGEAMIEAVNRGDDKTFAKLQAEAERIRALVR